MNNNIAIIQTTIISLNIIDIAVSSLQTLHGSKFIIRHSFFFFNQNYQYLCFKFLLRFDYLKEILAVKEGDNFVRFLWNQQRDRQRYNSNEDTSNNKKRRRRVWQFSTDIVYREVIFFTWYISFYSAVTDFWKLYAAFSLTIAGRECVKCRSCTFLAFPRLSFSTFYALYLVVEHEERHAPAGWTLAHAAPVNVYRF